MKNMIYRMYIKRTIVGIFTVVAIVGVVFAYWWASGVVRPQTIIIRDSKGTVTQRISNVYNVQMKSSSVSYETNFLISPTYQIKLKNNDSAETEFK